jgi:hypothetical protein
MLPCELLLTDSPPQCLEYPQIEIPEKIAEILLNTSKLNIRVEEKYRLCHYVREMFDNYCCRTYSAVQY